MKERTKFILEWERRWNATEGGPVNMSELARVFGISRQTGYQWVDRYKDAGFKLDALEERSHRPQTTPTAVPEDVQDALVAARKAHPKWGPKKLRAWLADRHPDRPWPSASTVGAILQRRGLSSPRRRRRRRGPVPGVVAPFAACEEPNAVWCVDFKGKFRLGDSTWCHVLTLIDAYSRYLLRCEAVLDPDGRHVEKVFDSAFREFGLPARIRSDNGPPFASTGAGGLTWLNAWWLRLGIGLERITPGKPYQNGRQERLHLSLDVDDVVGRANLGAQQRAIDLWRREYNEERPHEALALKPPARVYLPSSRRYPRAPVRVQTLPWSRVFEVDRNGFVSWKGRKLFISSALGHELVEADPDPANERWHFRFGRIELGYVDDNRPSRGLIIPRRRRDPRARVSTIILD